MTADDEVMTFGEFRRRFRLCPKGHRKGLSSKGPDWCWNCEQIERKAACPHDGPRYWYNPSNLPGENRWECGACGKAMLPPQVESVTEPGHVHGKGCSC